MPLAPTVSGTEAGDGGPPPAAAEPPGAAEPWWRSHSRSEEPVLDPARVQRCDHQRQPQ